MFDEENLNAQIPDEQIIKFHSFYQQNPIHSFQLTAKDSLIEVKQMQSETLELT